MFGLFKGGERIPARLAGAGAPSSHSCNLSTCGGTATWECMYTDSTGASCGSHWCQDHLLVVDGAPFCRRHAGVASLLLTRVGTLLEMPVPPVHDRSLPLLLRLAAQINESAVQLLQHLYRDRQDVTVPTHATIREFRNLGRVDGWQAVWSATAQTGYLTVISLRTSLAEPPAVALCRDGLVVSEGIPDWILQRDDDRWNGAGDAGFVDGLMDGLVGVFAAGVS